MDIVAKINDDNSFGGNFYTKDVKENWNTTDLIYDSNYLKPKWNDSVWCEGASQEEIDKINYDKKIQSVRQFLAKKKQEGKDYFNEFELIITMQLAGMLIVDLVAVTNEIDTVLYKPLNLIKNGDFFSAMMLFNNPNTVAPTIPIVLNHWNDIKVFTQNYFAENYPQEPIV